MRVVLLAFAMLFAAPASAPAALTAEPPAVAATPARFDGGSTQAFAESRAALDGKTLAEVDAMAATAPAQITIEIETSDDT